MELSNQCLLIDNDNEDNEIFCMALQEVDSSFRCICATDGLVALELLSKCGPSVPTFIFVDMNMPLMNGLECLSRLREIVQLNDVPIFMYSTGCNPELIREARQAGATDFIEKPSSFEGLKRLLAGLIKQHHLYEVQGAI